MSIYRFLLKIPLQFYGVAFVIIALMAQQASPFLELNNYDSASSFLSVLLNKELLKLSEILNIELKITFLFTGLLVILVLIFTKIKIIKFKFYDLNITAPIIAFLFTGPVLFSLIIDLNYLLSGLLTLVIFFFHSKFLENQKNTDLIFLILVSLIALVFNNYYFLIFMTIMILFKMINFKINNKEKINIISKITSLYLLFFIILIINLIKQEPSLWAFEFSFVSLINKTFFLFIMLLPLIGFFINALFFNFFNKSNWNAELFLFLILTIFAFAIYLFSNSEDLSPLIFGSSIISIYIFRTLEFVKFKWTKIPFLLIILLPLTVIFFDFSLYQSSQDVPYINYFFYLVIILVGLINPFFYLENLTVIEVLKISLFPIFLNSILILGFITLQYKQLYISEVIKNTIVNDFNCEIESTDLKFESFEPNIYKKYSDNIPQFDNEGTCKIMVKFATLDNLPIDNTNSINKTVINWHLRKFININISKI